MLLIGACRTKSVTKKDIEKSLQLYCNKLDKDATRPTKEAADE